jgi:D-sedoheptulose 7-phosphate isomerase
MTAINGSSQTPLLVGAAHVTALSDALLRFGDCVEIAQRWGEQLASVLSSGARLLAVGNGGSAAQAQHLTAELVGRYRDDRPPFSAIALHTETSSVTAIANDYGMQEVFARQVRAHGRPGDLLVALSTSGGSPNVVAAVRAAHDLDIATWAMTGPVPNQLASIADETLSVDAMATATVQELHLVALHLICASLDSALQLSDAGLADDAAVGGEGATLVSPVTVRRSAPSAAMRRGVPSLWGTKRTSGSNEDPA